MDLGSLPRVRNHQRRVSKLKSVERIHVAAAAIFNADGEVLVGKRFDDAHQGGLWEFPGGKLNAGEAVPAGLARELKEELDVQIDSARPLIRVSHDYADRRVLLDVWWVSRWRGEARGREGQDIRWVTPDALVELEFPAADIPIIAAVRLPDAYLITPEPEHRADAFLQRLAESIEAGVELVQLRAKALPEAELTALARKAVALCRERGVRLLVNGDPSIVAGTGADGVHLDSGRLMASRHRPVARDVWLGVSCHDARELAQAMHIEADFAVLSPVAETPDHPMLAPLGWKRFEELVAEANLPVYALGGMGRGDLDRAWASGAQGIAAIRGLWKA